jgi:hypothetical protein
MAKKDKRVDAYIAKAQPFAKPILTHLRALVHATIPEVEEEIKWGFPHFTYKGMYAGMSAFKGHCSFGFWKHALVAEQMKASRERGEGAMGSFGKITSMDDLPTDAVLKKWLLAAKKLNDAGVKPVKKKVVPAKDRVLEVPVYFAAAVKKDKKAQATWDGFSYSARKEYVEWVTEAKAEATRDKRLAQTVEWLAEGKRRNWKYENC